MTPGKYMVFVTAYQYRPRLIRFR